MARTFVYFAGAPAVAAEAISFVELASAGDPLAKTRLVYPGSPPPLNPITYFTNPVRRPGFDNDNVITLPANTLVETLDDKVLVSFGQKLLDRIVEEVWTNEAGLSMSLPMLRELRNYHENPPDSDVDGFIQWFPANQSTLGFNVQLVHLQVADNPLIPDMTEFRPIGGDGVNAGPDGDLGVEFANAGWVDREVRQTIRLVSQVP